MPLQATSGAASYDAFGGGVPAVTNYIEDVFQTWLYTGTGSAITITNGINLSANGGMVWLKNRNSTDTHQITDSARGVNRQIDSQSSSPQTTLSNIITAFNTTGFTLGTNAITNTSSNTYASWTWREKSNFFDVVTYTGTGANRTISHNLGSTPGCIIVKRTDGTNSDWFVYHRSLTSAAYRIRLNSTGIETSVPTAWNSTAPTSTVFSLGTATEVNENGGTYVAYLFAHNAGGFGLTGTDNVISCGSYTTDSGAASAFTSLGYEPQWILSKQITETGNWIITDNMRGLLGGPGTLSQNLYPDLSNAESDSGRSFEINQSGFKQNGGGTAGTVTCIYIAIRRGPMKVPTDATKVFKPTAYTGNGSSQSINAGFPIDLSMFRIRGSIGQTLVDDRLRGAPQRLFTDSTLGEDTSASAVTSLASNTSVTVGTNGDTNSNTATYVNWSFGRAPGFFDEVCYTGTGSNRTITHRLGVVPELMIVKGRSGATAWQVYASALANTEYVVLNTTAAKATGATRWNSTTPTTSVFSIGTATEVNTSAATYVAYLFATCAGVSKVGSYTGTATTKQIDCGFTGGARFVLIKRTDSTGDWYVWDSARGIIAGNDPYLLLNSTAAEVTNTDYIDTYSAGFEISSTAPAAINASGGSFIFLAIA
jgi:hypothetical protein